MMRVTAKRERGRERERGVCLFGEETLESNQEYSRGKVKELSARTLSCPSSHIPNYQSILEFEFDHLLLIPLREFRKCRLSTIYHCS